MKIQRDLQLRTANPATSPKEGEGSDSTISAPDPYREEKAPWPKKAPAYLLKKSKD